MRNSTSYNAHAIWVQGIVDVTPSKTRSQAYNRIVGANSELVHPLQINKDTCVVDTGPAGIRGVAAATDREVRFKVADDFEGLGCLCRRSWK